MIPTVFMLGSLSFFCYHSIFPGETQRQSYKSKPKETIRKPAGEDLTAANAEKNSIAFQKGEKIRNEKTCPSQVAKLDNL